MAIETFRILDSLAPPVLTNLLKKRLTVYNFRYSSISHIPTVRTSKVGKSSSKYAAPVLWNSLPEDFRNCRNCSDFNQIRQMIYYGMGKSVNALLAIVFEYSIGEPAKFCVIFVLCVFQYFNMFRLHFNVLILPVQSCFRFA